MKEGQAQFSVAQFFKDGSYEYVRRWVTARQAMLAFAHYSNSVGAKLGTTVRVTITDGGDCTCYEWEFEKGITFPSDEERASVKD